MAVVTNELIYNLMLDIQAEQKAMRAELVAMPQQLAHADGKNRQQPSPNLDSYIESRAVK